MPDKSATAQPESAKWSESSLYGRKLLWVADTLHGSIPISEIEKRAISTMLFNRLHNVLQNATAFLTFPSNRTSRFIHSIGCMHIAGQMLRFGLVNATEHDLELFFQKLELVFAAVENSATQKYSESLYHGSYLGGYHVPQNSSALFDPLYRLLTPRQLDNTKQFRYSILLQAVRLVALSHDLGHLPYSHIIEYALKGVYQSCCDENLQKEWAKLFRARLRPYVDGGGAMHEQLGRVLTRKLLQDVGETLLGAPRTGQTYFGGGTGNQLNSLVYFNYLLIQELTMMILGAKSAASEHGGFLKAMYRIVDGELDADRLDYVVRDAIASGLHDSSIEYDRLLSSYQMVHASGKGDDYEFDFIPSIRSLNAVQEFYHRRFNLYRSVFFHHRVTKTDGLLQEVVEDLVSTQLHSEDDPDVADVIQSELPVAPEGIWIPLIAPDSTSYWKHYVAWDDSFLLAVLRKEYFNLLHTRYANPAPDGDEADESKRLENRLSELLSNSKSYFPLFKRAESFSQVDSSFLSACSAAQAELESVLRGLRAGLTTGPGGGTSPSIDVLYRNLMARLKAQGGTEPELRMLQDNSSLFITQFMELLSSLGVVGSGSSEFSVAWLKRARADLLASFPMLDDALFVVKSLRKYATLSAPLYMVYAQPSDGASEVDCREIHEVSHVFDELLLRARTFPPFFFYICKKDASAFKSPELETMRKAFGGKLFGAFMEEARNIN